MDILSKTVYDNYVVYGVHIDETKFLEDGTTPDPAWVAEFKWGIDVDSATAEAEMLRICELEKSQRLGTEAPDTAMFVMSGSQLNTVKSQLNNVKGDLVKRLQAGTVTSIKLIGDSITYGAAASGAGDGSNETGATIFTDTDDTIYHEAPHDIPSWANKLRAYVAALDQTITFLNGGIGGKSAKWGNARKALWVSEAEDVVFVMLGTNDRWDCATTAEFESELTGFLDYVDDHSETMIVMTATPTSTDDEVTNNFGMEEVDRVITKVCADKGYTHISLYREMLNYLLFTHKVATDYIQSDGSHPWDAGHLLIWQILQRELGFIDDQDNWYDLREVTENLKTQVYTKVLPTTAINATDDDENLVFGVNCLTLTNIPSVYGGDNSFPDNAGGMLLTLRGSATADVYAQQLYIVTQSKHMYRRYWTSANQWSDWIKLHNMTEIETPNTIAQFTLAAGGRTRKVLTTSQTLLGTSIINVTPATFMPDGVIWSWTRASGTQIYINFHNAGLGEVTVNETTWRVNQILA